MKPLAKSPLKLLSLVVLSLGSAKSFAAVSDGPYLVPGDRGQWVARWVDAGGRDAVARSQPVTVGKEFTVPAVGACPAFKVRVRKPEPVAPSEVRFPKQNPLFVLADTHGEYQILCEFLQKQRLIDSSLHWVFGRGHLVVTGDIFDRGPNQTEILWLFYQLEAEAKRAGGGLHLLLGNHEVMAMRGDTGYLNDKYKQTASALGVSAYAELFAPNTLLGQWLRSKPIVLKANSVVAMHGGLSKDVLASGLSLREINDTARAVLSQPGDSKTEMSEREKLVMGKLGPLWFRGYFAEQTDFPTASDEDVSHVLETFGVQTIAVGHTIVPTVTPLYAGKVLAVQVYPHRDKQSGAPVLEGAVLVDNVWQRARIDGSREPIYSVGK